MPSTNCGALDKSVHIAAPQLSRLSHLQNGIRRIYTWGIDDAGLTGKKRSATEMSRIP